MTLFQHPPFRHKCVLQPLKNGEATSITHTQWVTEFVASLVLSCTSSAYNTYPKFTMTMFLICFGIRWKQSDVKPRRLVLSVLTLTDQLIRAEIARGAIAWALVAQGVSRLDALIWSRMQIIRCIAVCYCMNLPLASRSRTFILNIRLVIRPAFAANKSLSSGTGLEVVGSC